MLGLVSAAAGFDPIDSRWVRCCIWFSSPAVGVFLGVYVVCSKIPSVAPRRLLSAFLGVNAVLFLVLVLTALLGQPHDGRTTHVAGLLLQATAILCGAWSGFAVAVRRGRTDTIVPPTVDMMHHSHTIRYIVGIAISTVAPRRRTAQDRKARGHEHAMHPASRPGWGGDGFADRAPPVLRGC